MFLSRSFAESVDLLFFFISVSDLLDYINPDDELKAKEMQRKQVRAKVGSSVETISHLYSTIGHSHTCTL